MNSNKTIQLEKMKSRLKNELDTVDSEERCIQDYRTEMDLLLQEKMAHVEELRLIHADINLVCGTLIRSKLAVNNTVGSTALKKTACALIFT